MPTSAVSELPHFGGDTATLQVPSAARNAQPPQRRWFEFAPRQARLLMARLCMRVWVCGPAFVPDLSYAGSKERHTSVCRPPPRAVTDAWLAAQRAPEASELPSQQQRQQRRGLVMDPNTGAYRPAGVASTPVRGRSASDTATLVTTSACSVTVACCRPLGILSGTFAERRVRAG